jgi:hypothetical protein
MPRPGTLVAIAGGVNGDTAMMTTTERHQPGARSRTLRSVAVVGSHPDPDALAAVVDAVDYDIVLIESPTHAFAQIRRQSPDLVIVCLDGEDAIGCRLLSMLAIDRQTSRIRVLTYIAAPSSSAGDAFDAAPGQMLGRFVPSPLN